MKATDFIRSEDWRATGQTSDKRPCMICGEPVMMLRSELTGRETLSAICESKACDAAMTRQVYGPTVCAN